MSVAWVDPGGQQRQLGVGKAEANVVSDGTIRIIPSDTTDRNPIGLWKRFTLIAPIGNVEIDLT